MPFNRIYWIHIKIFSIKQFTRWQHNFILSYLKLLSYIIVTIVDCKWLEGVLYMTVQTKEEAKTCDMYIGTIDRKAPRKTNWMCVFVFVCATYAPHTRYIFRFGQFFTWNVALKTNHRIIYKSTNWSYKSATMFLFYWKRSLFVGGISFLINFEGRFVEHYIWIYRVIGLCGA